MKLVIDQRLDGGVYKVKIAVSDFTASEQEKISKFGSPIISVSPQHIWTGRENIRTLPIHALGHTFTFDDEEKADKFVADMQTRIKDAIETLRSKEDKFTDRKEYEL